jgi:uncharacterized membrane protein YccF (DUF307 family)
LAAPAIVEVSTGPSLLVRAVWYVLVGWWLTAIVLGLAWFLAATIIGLPITFYLVNRVPTVLTLRPRAEQYQLVAGGDGVTRYQRLEAQQESLLVRALYFVLIGWWASLTWIAIAYVFLVTIIGIPIGLLMVNRLPFVFSLHRGYA